MVDIYIKDDFGNILFTEKIQHLNHQHYEKKVFINSEDSITLTVVFNPKISAPVSPDGSFPEKEMIIFNKVVELIGNDLSTNFSIEELAEIAGMNRTKLQAGFKQTFHKTINSFTKDLKMQKAKELLISNQGLGLKEIAGMLGYKHANHFSVAFKKRSGSSPSVFKNTVNI